MRYLKSQGHDVRAIAPYDGFADRLKKEFRFIGLENLDRKGKSFLKDFNFFEELYRIYKEHKPDLVLHFTIKPNIYGSIACGLLGIPSVANVTGLGYVFTGKSFLSLIVKKLYKFSFSFSEKVVFQNPVDYDFFISGKIIPLGKGAIIPGSGVNTEKFSPEFCKNLGKNKDSKNKIVFLFNGSGAYGQKTDDQSRHDRQSSQRGGYTENRRKGCSGIFCEHGGQGSQGGQALQGGRPGNLRAQEKQGPQGREPRHRRAHQDQG
jgi:hypothetical protein